MRLAESVKLATAIKELSKENEAWARVYSQYLICLGLIFAVILLRRFTQCLVALAAICGVYYVFSHSPLYHVVTTSSLYKWVINFTHPPQIPGK